MKLVISELNERAQYTSREAAYIIRALIDNHGWKQIETPELCDASGSLESLLLRKFTELPKVILSWEGYSAYTGAGPFLPPSASTLKKG